ncbi:MAG: hypothetical protein AAB074_15660 [Planctomycetota bacterium]
MGACCGGCDEGASCAGKQPAAVLLPPDLIIPGPDPDRTGVLELEEVPDETTSDESVPLITKSLGPTRPVALNTRLVLTDGGTTVSEALHVRGCNSGSVDLVVFLLNSISTIDAVLEGGIDGENYRRISSTRFSAAGFARFRFRRVGYRFLRVYYSASGSAGGVAVLTTTINGSSN